jgi:hypothetical protein
MERPPSGWLVAHGSYIRSSGSSVCGGIVRDRKGFFIKAFIRKIISPSNALVAGLLAILSSSQFDITLNLNILRHSVRNLTQVSVDMIDHSYTFYLYIGHGQR